MAYLSKRKVHDVCIIGSGAGGGMAAKVLCEAGADVVMLEAGQSFYSEGDSAMLRWNYDSPRRGAAIPSRHFGEFDACIGGWTIEGEPYTRAEGTDWQWWRARNLGGRTHHWGRISLRFGPDDFKRRSIDGMGDDWPIGYDDISPYYDRLDRLVGIFGSNEGIRNEPDGIFLPPPRPRCYEMLIKDACDNLDITCIPSRLSILTKPHNGRPACHYCGQCGRGCATNSNFSSPSVLIRPALQTGNLTLITGAMAREVLTNSEGLATGVSYVNTADGTEQQVAARVVVLSASACESARLLLNSASTQHPNGLANGSDTAGRYITDTTGVSVQGVFPQLLDSPPHNEDGTGGLHYYIPWWRDGKKNDFKRGYHIEFWGGRSMPGYGFMGGIDRLNSRWAPGGQPRPRGGGGYGTQLKEDYRRFYGATIGFSLRGEMLARRDNRCTIDPDVVDKYGIPVLNFDVTFSEQEVLQAKHGQETIRSIIHQMGGEPLDSMPDKDASYGLQPPGWIIHEVGGTRMGHDRRSSVLNAFGQAHEAKNVFVADGGPFVSQAHKNPTWTILALSWRTADYIIDQRNRGNL